MLGRDFIEKPPAHRPHAHCYRNLYCMSESSFTSSMPFQLIGRNSNATNIIIDNILEALASLPEEDSASVEVLMLENITDVAVRHL